MPLNSNDIERAFKANVWQFYDKNGDWPKYDANGIDVTLGSVFLYDDSTTRVVYDEKAFAHRIFSDRTSRQPRYEWRKLILKEGERIIMMGSGCLLGCINQRINCTKPLERVGPANDTSKKGNGRYFQQAIDAKSTVARRGVCVQTAANGQYGFDGVFTLELSPMGSTTVEMIPGMEIAQIFFNEVEVVDCLPTPTVGSYDQSSWCPVAPKKNLLNVPTTKLKK